MSANKEYKTKSHRSDKPILSYRISVASAPEIFETHITRIHSSDRDVAQIMNLFGVDLRTECLASCFTLHHTHSLFVALLYTTRATSIPPPRRTHTYTNSTHSRSYIYICICICSVYRNTRHMDTTTAAEPLPIKRDQDSVLHSSASSTRGLSFV